RTAVGRRTVPAPGPTTPWNGRRRLPPPGCAVRSRPVRPPRWRRWSPTIRTGASGRPPSAPSPASPTPRPAACRRPSPRRCRVARSGPAPGCGPPPTPTPPSAGGPPIWPPPSAGLPTTGAPQEHPLFPRNAGSISPPTPPSTGAPHEHPLFPRNAGSWRCSSNCSATATPPSPRPRPGRWVRWGTAAPSPTSPRPPPLIATRWSGRRRWRRSGRSATPAGSTPCWPPAPTSRPSAAGPSSPWPPSRARPSTPPCRRRSPTRTGRPARPPRTCSTDNGPLRLRPPPAARRPPPPARTPPHQTGVPFPLQGGKRTPVARPGPARPFRRSITAPGRETNASCPTGPGLIIPAFHFRPRAVNERRCPTGPGPAIPAFHFRPRAVNERQLGRSGGCGPSAGGLGDDRADRVLAQRPVLAALPRLGLPDRHGLLQRVDAVLGRGEGVGPVGRRYDHDHAGLGQLQPARPVQQGDPDDVGPAPPALGGHFAQPDDRLLLVGLVGEGLDPRATLGAVAHGAGEAHHATDVRQRRPLHGLGGRQ